MKTYKISVHVPESHLEQVKTAMFEQKAGQIGAYDYCAWQTLGMGQYRPLPGSQPFAGEQGKINRVPEFLVEIVCEKQFLIAVIDAMLAAHPYEVPSYSIVPILIRDDCVDE